MKTPCDEVVVQSRTADDPCSAKTGPWVLAATIVGSSMAFIDGTVVNVALPALQSSFHATVVGVQWVVESYGLFLAALILVGGALGDRYGRRLIFLVGVGIFAVASAACGFSSSIEQLIIARSIQGIGAAFLVPGSLAIISASFDEKSRGQAIGTWSGFTAITTALGPVFGGWLVQNASWHWVFFLNLPLAAAVIAISLWRIPETRNRAAGRLDWTGALLATIGLGGLVNGFLESSTFGWSHPLVFGSLGAGVAALVVFVFVEARTHSPMVPLTLFKSHAFSGAKSADLAALFRARDFFLPVSNEFDPGTKIFGDGNRCICLATHSAHVPSVALVRRVGDALRPQESADNRPSHSGRRLRSLRRARNRRQLLGNIFACVCCSRFWFGGQRRSFDHGGDEFSRSGSCRYCLWHQ